MTHEMPPNKSAAATLRPPRLTTNVGVMIAHTQSKALFWSWALIVSALVVVGENVAVRVTPYARQYSGVSALATVVSGVSLVFLFFGSPFLVRSQGWFAIIGWCIAFATILFSVL